MKIYCLYTRLFAFLCLSALAVQAIPLSSAKVLIVKGAASYGALGSEETPITEGAILFEGDSIVTGSMDVVYLIFSNGVGLTIEENSNVVFSKLDQKPFWRDNPDEYPEEEISKSNFVLELKYGVVKGHVKGLRKDSEFRIKTMLGDAIVSGNLFSMRLVYDSFKKKYILDVQNVNGIVDFVTKFSGPLQFGRSPAVNKSYDTDASVFQIVRIPPKRAISMRGSRFDPKFGNLYQRFPKDSKSKLVAEFDTIEPFITPIDQEVMVVSPNGTPDDMAESDAVVEGEPSALMEGEPDILVEETMPKPLSEEIMPDIVAKEVMPDIVVEEVVPGIEVEGIEPDPAVESETIEPESK